jgi:hypothetical protein
MDTPNRFVVITDYTLLSQHATFEEAAEHGATTCERQFAIFELLPSGYLQHALTGRAKWVR